MKIGVYAPNWVGDAVMSLPFINELHRQFPNYELTVIAKEWVIPVYENHPLVHDIFTLYPHMLNGYFNMVDTGKSLKKLKLDVLYILPNSFRSAFISRLSAAKNRIGYKSQGRSMFLNQALPNPREKCHRSESYFFLINKKGANDENQNIGITLSEKEKERANVIFQNNNFQNPIGILPGSVAKSRTVPMEKWIEILSHKKAEDKRFVLIGGKGDIKIADKIMESNLKPTIISFCGKYSLRESMALISQCSAVIATDSGLGHIAANLSIPTISLFGAGDPSQTRPLGNSIQVITANKMCSPCRKNICSNKMSPLICLNSIVGDDIWGVYTTLCLV